MNHCKTLIAAIFAMGITSHAQETFITKEIEKILIDTKQYKDEILVELDNASGMVLQSAEIRCFKMKSDGRFTGFDLVAKDETKTDLKPGKKVRVRLQATTGHMADYCSIFNAKMREKRFYE